MGTPLATIFAEICMVHFEEQYLPTLFNNNGSKLFAWRRYVDDTFTIFKEDADEKEIQHLLNTFHPCIKFTVEPETNGEISFLDVLVKRHDERFDTTVYKKKTTTKLMLRWDSLIPISYRKSSLTTLADRAYRVCSKPDLLQNEFQYIRIMANFNNYPQSFVEKIIYEQSAKVNRIQVQRQEQNLVKLKPSENQKHKYIEIPYTGRPSYVSAKRLKSIIRQNDPATNLRVIYQTANTTKKLFRTKDKLTINQKSGVIYEISYLDCPSTYIGKTIKLTYKRLQEHEKDVTKAKNYLESNSSQPHSTNNYNQHVLNGRIQRRKSTQELRRSSRIMRRKLVHRSLTQQRQQNVSHYKPNSALGKHVRDTGHSIDFKDVKMLTQDPKPYRLMIKESIQIRSRQPPSGQKTINHKPMSPINIIHLLPNLQTEYFNNHSTQPIRSEYLIAFHDNI